MQAIFNIAITAVLQQLRETGSLFTLFVVPAILMVAIGTFNRDQAPTTLIFDVVADPAAGELAPKFVDLLRAEGQKPNKAGQPVFVVCQPGVPDQPVTCKFAAPQGAPGEVAAARLTENVTHAAITLPADFTQTLNSGGQAAVGVRTRSDVQLQQTIQGYVSAVNTRLGGAVLAARAITASVGGDQAVYTRALTNAQALWDADPVALTETYSTLTGEMTGTGFGQSAPGTAAMFVLFNALSLTQVFITERKNWTMQRLMIMPITPAQILGGKLFGQYILGLMQFGVMIIVGTLLGVRWGDPLGVAALVLAYTLSVTALGLALSTLIKTSGQAQGVSLLIGMTLSPLGGAWWPLSITPPVMQTIGRVISPIAWSQEGFTKLIFYGAGFVDVLPQVGVLLLFAAVFFALGLARFQFDI
jgi:ABC-2 type transport system permease protein